MDIKSELEYRKEQIDELNDYLSINLGYDEDTSVFEKESIYDDYFSDEEIELPYNYTPRPYQQYVWDDMFNFDNEGDLVLDKNRFPIKQLYKRMVRIWHRRAGKDLDTWQAFLTIANLRAGIYWYFLPTNTQAREVIFEGRDNSNRRFIDYLPRSAIHPRMFKHTDNGWNSSTMSTQLRNGSFIKILGSDNYDRLVGANPAGVVFSEYALCDPTAWSYIRPMIVANDGFAWFIYTPRGRNHGYDLMEEARNNPTKWSLSIKKANETGVFTEDQLEDEKKTMPESKFLSEYYVDFDAPVEGSYYSKQIIDVYKEDRFEIFDIPKSPVKVAMDLGTSDYTTMVFFQETKGQVNVLYYFESEGQDIDFYYEEIKRFEDVSKLRVTEIILPHDAKQRERTSARSFYDVLCDMTTKLVTVCKKIELNSGVAACRRVLPNCMFYKGEEFIHPEFKDKSSGVKLLLNRLSTYSKEFNKKNNIFIDKPVHDANSHAADGFRYMGCTIDLNRLTLSKRINITIKTNVKIK